MLLTLVGFEDLVPVILGIEWPYDVSISDPIDKSDVLEDLLGIWFHADIYLNSSKFVIRRTELTENWTHRACPLISIYGLSRGSHHTKKILWCGCTHWFLLIKFLNLLQGWFFKNFTLEYIYVFYVYLVHFRKVLYSYLVSIPSSLSMLNESLFKSHLNAIKDGAHKLHIELRV